MHHLAGKIPAGPDLDGKNDPIGFRGRVETPAESKAWLYTSPVGVEVFRSLVMGMNW